MNDDIRQRQLACIELLRREASRAGLLPAGDALTADAIADNAIADEAAAQAIERLLEARIPVEEPGEDECRRHYEAHPAEFSTSERLRVRHVLLAVTPGVDVAALRRRAEALMLELRCARDDGQSFAQAARRYSNCPSAQHGGDLGWLTRGDCAPEIDAVLFDPEPGQPAGLGVLPRVARSRHGLHVFEIVEREAGCLRPYASVQPAIRQRLRQQRWISATRRYLQALAEREGVAIG